MLRHRSVARTDQRKRLVRDHSFDDYVACFFWIKPVLRDEIVTLAYNSVDILRHLQVFIAVFVAETHAFADDLENIDDAEGDDF